MAFAGNSPAERRITLQMLAYWEKLRSGRPMPAEHEISPQDIGDLWQECFILHLAGENGFSVHTISDELASMLQYERDKLDPVWLPEDRQDSWLADMAKSQRPLLHEGDFVNKRGRLVRFRQCLLPLGEEGRLTAVLGALRCKEV